MLLLPESVITYTTGSSEEALAGSGDLTIPGIEAILEYNGIYFNQRGWIDKIRVTELDGIGDPDVRFQAEQRQAEDGELPRESLYGGRTITMNCRVESNNLKKMRDMIYGFRTAFVDLNTEYPLYFHTFPFDGTSGVFIKCKKSAATSPREAQGNFQFNRDILMTTRALDPRFYSKELMFATASFVDGYLGVDLENKGNYYTHPVYRIDGGITDPVLTNGTTGVSFQIEGTIPVGDFFTIDVSKKTIKNKDGINMMGNVPATAKWPKLTSGINYFQLEGSGLSQPDGVPALTVTWRHAFI